MELIIFYSVILYTFYILSKTTVIIPMMHKRVHNCVKFAILIIINLNIKFQLYDKNIVRENVFFILICTEKFSPCTKIILKK